MSRDHLPNSTYIIKVLIIDTIPPVSDFFGLYSNCKQLLMFAIIT